MNNSMLTRKVPKLANCVASFSRPCGIPANCLKGNARLPLQDMAGQLGYTKEQTPQFVEYVNSIYEMTNPGTIFRSVMGGGEGARGGFPGGGRGGGTGGTGGGGR